jgi:hypothetical protein
VDPTASDYGREGEEAWPMKWIELTVGPAKRNMPTRIKGGPRMTTGLTEKRVRNGIGKNIERHDESDHKRYRERLREI